MKIAPFSLRRARWVLLCFFVGLLLSMRPALAMEIVEVTGEKSGVKAWLVEDHKLPLVALRLAFRGGSEQDPADKQGLATLTMNALTEGADDLDATAFQKELAEASISLDFSSGRDDLEGGLKCLSSDAPKAFDLMRKALTKPRFDTAAVERLRAQQLAGLRQLVGDPGWQARYALFSDIYAGHPYGQRSLGTTQTLKAISLADLRDFAARHLARDNVTIAAAGDISPKELAAALDKIFADLPAHARLAPIPDVPPRGEGLAVLVPREGTQTDFLFALSGPRRDDPDWYAAEVANYILGGGGFSSRLMQEVRDKRGLTYGIGTGLMPTDHDGLIVGQAAVENGKASEAWQAILDTMRHYRDEGAKPAEITAAKDYLTGAMPLALASTDKIAEMLVYMQREKLGRDYLDRYADLVRGVAPRDVERALERWFDPDGLAVVMVGKPDPAPLRDMKTKEMVRQ